ncbi:hypothetical protein GCM10019017_15670 [Streptomyces showdoensis]
MPPAVRRPMRDALRVTSGCAAVEVCRRFGSVVRWRRRVGREGACDAGVRAHRAGSPVGTAGERGVPLRAGRPDNINVWHAVSPDKALRANNFTQMQSGAHG